MAGRRIMRVAPAEATVTGLTGAESAAEVPAVLDKERERVLVAVAEAPIFEPYEVPQVGFRYAWEEQGKPFSFTVKDVVGIQRITNAEFHGGNRFYEELYRGDVLVQTNDPRKKSQVQKDPGPVVKVRAGGGTTIEMHPDEFLALVNKHRATKTRMTAAGRVR